ncbi:MAG TPA: histidine phosphatase family protein [Acidimicrobiales bacterium]|jgi:broad specificity phosphatase PhoE|nr:histidine phosphatase family protein [Acidimicrobiales bacterium]
MGVEIVFESHASTEDNGNGIATGWLPGRLSETGRGSAVALGLRRRHDGLAAVFTSDLARAVETVEIAFAGADLPIFTDRRLRECDYGVLNGAPSHEVHGDRGSHLEVPYPQGESWRLATDRVGRALPDLLARGNERKVLIVGHVATRWALERFIEGRDLRDLASEEFVWQQSWEYHLA